MRAFRTRTRGRVATSAHPLEVAAYVVVPSARLVRRLTRDQPRALQVPHRRGPLVVVTPGLVRRAHANGLEVHVWTIDDPAEMHQLVDRGVDGLMTDRTDILKDVLRDRGLWEEPS
jgi:glycerophosphoryl diester phosphodiesterase